MGKRNALVFSNGEPVKIGKRGLASPDRKVYKSRCGRYRIESRVQSNALRTTAYSLFALRLPPYVEPTDRDMVLIVSAHFSLAEAKEGAQAIEGMREDYERRPTPEDVREWEADRQRFLEDPGSGFPWYDDLTGPLLAADRAEKALRQLGLLK